LDELASTPLAVRLLYSKINGARFGCRFDRGSALWTVDRAARPVVGARDTRAVHWTGSKSKFPTAEDRTDVLATLARVVAGKRVSRDEAEEVLRERVGGRLSGRETSPSVFQQAGLINLDEEVGFNFQPLLEMSAAVAVLSRWLAGLTPTARGNRSLAHCGVRRSRLPPTWFP